MMQGSHQSRRPAAEPGPQARPWSDRLTRAWLALLLFSAVSTVVALALPTLDPVWVRVAGILILVLAWLKARVILARYLDLDRVPRIGRGFGLVLGLVMAAAAALFLAA